MWFQKGIFNWNICFSIWYFDMREDCMVLNVQLKLTTFHPWSMTMSNADNKSIMDRCYECIMDRCYECTSVLRLCYQNSMEWWIKRSSTIGKCSPLFFPKFACPCVCVCCFDSVFVAMCHSLFTKSMFIWIKEKRKI